MNEVDRVQLEEFPRLEQRFKDTQEHILNNVSLRPFEYKQPLFRWIGFRALSILIMLACTYTSLLIVTLTMFNLIVLGVLVVYLLKLVYFLEGIEMKQDDNFRNRPFRQFIADQNRQHFEPEFSVILVGGEQGRCLELQLPVESDESVNPKKDSLKSINEEK